jgi:hypothetical protein
MGRLEKIRAVVRLEVIYLFEIIFEKYLKGHTPALKGHTPKKKFSIGSDLPLSIFD